MRLSIKLTQIKNNKSEIFKRIKLKKKQWKHIKNYKKSMQKNYTK